jgi:hypothetical protein
VALTTGGTPGLKTTTKRKKPIKHLQIVVAGFIRNLSTTLPSIQENVIDEAYSIAQKVSVSYVLSRSREEIKNLWSGEQGLPEHSLPPSIAGAEVKLFDQTQVDIEISSVYESVVEARGAISEVDRDITRNLIRYLWVLNQARQVIHEDADYVVHIRPDLSFIDKFDFSSLRAPMQCLRLKGLATANWGWQPNDRFALMSRSYVEPYFTRLLRIEEFSYSHHEFSGETLLLYSIGPSKIRASLDVRAARVRIGGELQDEPFGKAKIHPTRRNRGSKSL